MPRATAHPISSRRGFLGHLTLAAIPIPGVAAESPSPDDELIRLCGQFDALEHRVLGLYETIKNDNARDAALVPFQEQQADLLDQITDLRATTLAGFMARARMLALYEPDWVKRLDVEPSWNQRMAGALIRDMAAGRAA